MNMVKEEKNRKYADVVALIQKRYDIADPYLERIHLFHANMTGSFIEFAAEIQRMAEIFNGSADQVREQIW